MAPVASKSSGNLPGSNNNGGRKKSKEWDFVEKVGENSYRCRFCNELVSGKIIRIQKHLSSCSEAKKNLSPPEVGEKSIALEYKSNMDRFVIKTSTADKYELDLAVSRFFFSANIPFNQIENKFFLEMLDKFRRGYVPPKRESLGEEFLEKIYMDCNNDIATEYEKSLERGMAITLCQVNFAL